MYGRLAVLKNILWAISIVVCLAALLVGLIFAAAVKYDGSGQIDSNAPAAALPTPGLPMVGDGTLRTLAETSDGGQSYVESLTFLCDSSLIGLRDYGLLPGGVNTMQVWGSMAGNIPAANIASCLIRYPADGSEISPANAATVSQPSVLVLSLGCDSLAGTTEEDFITNYSSLITAIRAASPNTTILCCSLIGVTGSYAGSDGLTNELVRQANEWITQVCKDTGAIFVDVASAVCDASGGLYSEYASANGKTLNSAGINEVLLYLRTHTI